MTDDDNVDRLSGAVEKGARLVGSLVGGAVGLVGGPPGALGGAAAGWAAGEALVSVGRSVVQRLDDRGAMRVGAAITVIETDAEQHRENGEPPRSDGYFDPRGELRPEAEDLLEGVLLVAANTYEEKKLPYLAHLYDGVVHDESVAAADGLYLVRAADQLTYRQLIGLAVFASAERYVMDLARAQAARDEGASIDPAFAWEFNDLAMRGLLGIESTDGIPRNPAGLVGGNAMTDFPYGQGRLMPPGDTLHRLMRLSSIPEGEQREWLSGLGGGSRS